MNGAVATSQVYLGAVTDLGFQVVGLADHNRDGRADVLWHHATSGDVWVWSMNGAAITDMSHVATVGTRTSTWPGLGLRRGRAGGRAVAPRNHRRGMGLADEWSSITSVTQVADGAGCGYQIVNTK